MSATVVRDLQGETLDDVVDALRQPSLPQQPVCDASARGLPAFAMQLVDGRWVHPEVPSDGCHPQDSAVYRLNEAAR